MRFIVTTLTALLLVGCSANTSGIAARSDSDSIRIDSSSVAADVQISQVRQRTHAGILQGSAMITSTVSSDRYWQYKFTFFDASGFTVEAEASPWVPLNLHGGEQRAVQAAAPSGIATSFELVVRPGPDQ